MPSKFKNLTNAGRGRTKGVGNKIQRAAKEAFGLAFEGLGGVDGLIVWGKRNRGEFYKLYSRLIPAEALASAAPLVSVTIGSGPISTAAEAAEAYRQIIGDPGFDFTRLSFAVPEASPSVAPLPLMPIEVTE